MNSADPTRKRCADPHAAFEKTLRRQVLAKAAIGRSSWPKLPTPVRVVFVWVSVDGLVDPTVHRQVRTARRL